MRPAHEKRDSFYAHKYVRLMTKSCATLDIGPAACLLCVYIVHQEDSIRYAAPVRFWNQQLMNIMGFNSPKQLDAARNKAIEAGWLVYTRGGNRQVGQYYCVIPDSVSGLSDTAIEDNRSGIGMNSGTNSGMNSGTNSDQHSIPVPIPIPKDYNRDDFAGPEIRIPPSIAAADVDRIKDVLHRYDLKLRTLASRKAFRGDDITIQSFWNTAASKTTEVFIEAAEAAIQGGWENLRFRSPSKRSKADGLSAEQEAEWVRIVAACRMTGEEGDLAKKALGAETCRIMRMIGGSDAVKSSTPGDFKESELRARFFATRESERKLAAVGVTV